MTLSGCAGTNDDGAGLNPEGKLVLRLNGVVTEEMLEQAIKKEDSSYSIQWAEQVPPEFKPE